jgi:hypothetical protein
LFICDGCDIPPHHLPKRCEYRVCALLNPLTGQAFPDDDFADRDMMSAGRLPRGGLDDRKNANQEIVGLLPGE